MCDIKRDSSLDLMKLLLMTMTILGHLDYIIPFWFEKLIYSVHMPAFVIISGYFFKPTENKKLLKSSAKSLVLPYFITLLSCNLFNQIRFHLFGYKPEILSSLTESGLTWFMIALFWGRLVFNQLAKLKYYWLWSALLSAASIISYKLIRIPFSVQAGLTFSMYLSIGRLFRQYEIPGKINRRSLIAGILLLWCIGGINMPKMNIKYCDYPFGVSNIIVAVTGTLALWKIFQYADRKIPERPKRFLTYLGSNTLLILCVHSVAVYAPWWAVPDVLEISRWWIVVPVIIINMLPVMLLEPLKKLLNNCKGKTSKKKLHKSAS